MTPARSRNEATSLSMDDRGRRGVGIKLNYDPNALSLGDQAREYKLRVANDDLRDSR